MKKVLVTGATGFIGNYAISLLIRNGMNVTATSSDKNKASVQPWFNQVNYIPFDFRSFNVNVDYFNFFERPDILLHLAWEGLPNYTSAFHLQENLPRHISFLNNLISNGLRDVTVAGTCLEYGMREGCLDEDMQPAPFTAYALAKDGLRNWLNDFAAKKPFVLKWLRLFYMYGKGQNSKSLFSQLDKAIENHESVFNMSGGEQIRDFLPVGDMAEYIVKVSCQKNVAGIVNCCSGNPVRVKDLIKAYLNEKDYNLKLNLGYYEYPPYEPMNFWGSRRKLNLLYNNE